MLSDARKLYEDSIKMLGSDNDPPWEALSIEAKEAWEDHVHTVETQDREVA
jgi:hypothetical protein